MQAQRKKNISNSVHQRQEQSVRSGKSMTPPSYGISFIDHQPVQRQENKTGMPDQLKSGVESLSGIDMSDVKVHYNSSQPAQLNAHAYAQGNQIHIAPGQEKHLPHEAWHVVQQKQGRVQSTNQMKGKVNVNDDAGLEKEADVMGVKSLQRKVKSPETDNREYFSSQSAIPIQRKFDLIKGNGEKLPAEEQGMKYTRALAIKNALVKHEESLKKFESEEDEDKVNELLEKISLIDEIIALNDSPIEYGEIDVNNVQQLAMIYFELKKRLLTPNGKISSLREEISKYSEQSKDRSTERDYKSRVRGLAEPAIGEEIYTLAILGTGASVAYYIENNLHTINPSETIVIGQQQPWRRERGAQGVINHPMHMIAPRYQRGKDLHDDTGGLASRQSFSDRVDEVINQLPKVNTGIKSVTKQGYAYTKYYKIEATDGKSYYAQHVVLGLGIGKHDLPPDVKRDAEKQRQIALPENAFKPNIPRVMNIDQFQQAISEGTIRKSDISSMVISGPNAAIDVATTAIRQGIKNVSWIVGYSGPLFLPGTDNVYAARSYAGARQPGGDKQILKEGDITYYKYYYDKVDVSAEGVQVTYAKRGATRDAPNEPVGTIRADIMVYGLGPDVSSIRNMLSRSTPGGADKRALSLEPIYDVNQHFNVDDHADLESALLAFYRDQLIKKGIRQNLEELALLGKNKAMQEWNKLNVIDKLQEPSAFDFKPAKKLPTVVGLQASKDNENDESSLTIIGGAAYRLSDKVKYTYLSGAYNNLLNDEVAPAVQALSHSGYRIAATAIQDIAVQSGQLVKDFENEETMPEYRRQYYLESVTQEMDNLKYWSTVDRQGSPEEKKKYTTLWKRVAHYQEMLQEFVTNVVANAAERQASTHMMKIPKTLPMNVGLSDQLTSIRSSEEARAEFVPGSVEHGINFITGDQTMLAAHVAIAYPNIPAPLANAIVQRVLLYRRHLPGKHAPLPNEMDEQDPKSYFSLKRQRHFQSFWNTYLTDANSHLKM